jgi:type IV pilus assembly protein PilC
MAQFNVKAQDANGKKVKMTLEAESRVAAVRKLKSQGLVPVEIVERGGQRAPSGGKKQGREKEGGKKKASEINIGGPKKAKILEIVVFCRQLAIAVSAGLPLRDALEGILESMEDNTLTQTLSPAVEALHSGVAFSESLSRHNKYDVFSPVFLGLIRVAEETGTMGDTLQKLADYLDETSKLKAAVKSKLAYPQFMIVAFVLVNLGATFFLFPMFAKNFGDLGADLPPLTQFVFDLNEKALAVAPYTISLVVAVIVSLIMYRRTPVGRVRFDETLLKFPLLGDVILKVGLARFCKTLAITAEGGVPLVQGLEISSVVVGNKHLESSLETVRNDVVNGNRFATTLKKTGNFPDLVVRMVDVGEDSGQLPLVLNKIADIYDTEVDNAIGKMLSLVEPILICLFGAFVTVMVLALYMPVFTMSSH